MYSKNTFERYKRKEVWDNVIAVVVQPGVEFGDDVVHEYNREAAAELANAIKKYPNIVFEGHSTDYQTPQALKEMVGGRRCHTEGRPCPYICVEGRTICIKSD